MSKVPKVAAPPLPLPSKATYDGWRRSRCEIPFSEVITPRTRKKETIFYINKILRTVWNGYAGLRRNTCTERGKLQFEVGRSGNILPITVRYPNDTFARQIYQFTVKNNQLDRYDTRHREIGLRLSSLVSTIIIMNCPIRCRFIV